jgi:hypothetical protein
MRKLQQISHMVEQQAVKKRMDKEKADHDYYNKVINSTLDVPKSTEGYSSPSGQNKYKERIERMLATQHTPQPSNKKVPGASKVSFYHRNNRSMLAERGLATISNEPKKSEDLRSTTISKTQER